MEMGADFRIPWRGPDNEQVNAIGAQTLRGMSSLFFPSFRRIEGGFAKGPRYSIIDGAVSYKYDRFGLPIRDKDTEALREVVSRFSTAVQSYHTHRFIVSISTDDIVELLTRKFADVSEKTSTLHAKSLEYITQKLLKGSYLTIRFQYWMVFKSRLSGLMRSEICYLNLFQC